MWDLLAAAATGLHAGAGLAQLAATPEPKSTGAARAGATQLELWGVPLSTAFPLAAIGGALGAYFRGGRSGLR